MGTGGTPAYARRLTLREDYAARAKGDEAERRVAAVLGRADRPSWIVKVRRARIGEDRGGVDIVVDTTSGRLFLQVKSSRRYAAQWRREHAGDVRPIGVVVVGASDDMAIVYGRALGALILLRERQEAATRTGRRS